MRKFKKQLAILLTLALVCGTFIAFSSISVSAAPVADLVAYGYKPGTDFLFADFMGAASQAEVSGAPGVAQTGSNTDTVNGIYTPGNYDQFYSKDNYKSAGGAWGPLIGTGVNGPVGHRYLAICMRTRPGQVLFDSYYSGNFGFKIDRSDAGGSWPGFDMSDGKYIPAAIGMPGPVFTSFTTVYWDLGPAGVPAVEYFMIHSYNNGFADLPRVDIAGIWFTPSMDPITTTTEAPLTTTEAPPTTTEAPPITTTIPIIDNTYAVMRIDHLYAAVNGKKEKVQEGQDLAPIFSSELRTMVPFRFIATCFGAALDWDEGAGSAIIDYKGKHIVLPIGAYYAYVDGVQTPITNPAQIMTEGRTFVPFRVVSELLGGINLDYDPGTMTIIASSDPIVAPYDVAFYVALFNNLCM